jgi:hypothetical protein
MKTLLAKSLAECRTATVQGKGEGVGLTAPPSPMDMPLLKNAAVLASNDTLWCTATTLLELMNT